ncbi:hypothetical protein BCR34DRAFT_597661 [Clohesyomyces aquaticus]|uniref:Uncharacterized protein n=1 Tax=Clohesyomyces aquaticus TaxID=1231657 RepID=A0A1Y2A239_9PLEO|nr:hypothetical protein BCR34DRAFT_597661 [Clohesyomyces aquaticus]
MPPKASAGAEKGKTAPKKRTARKNPMTTSNAPKPITQKISKRKNGHGKKKQAAPKSPKDHSSHESQSAEEGEIDMGTFVGLGATAATDSARPEHERTTEADESEYESDALSGDTRESVEHVQGLAGYARKSPRYAQVPEDSASEAAEYNQDQVGYAQESGDSNSNTGEYDQVPEGHFQGPVKYASKSVENSPEPAEEDPRLRHFIDHVGDTVIDLYNHLNTDLPHMTLPDIEESDENSDSNACFGMKHLVHLYIHAYYHKQWNITDLVADIWIRAFHAVEGDEDQHLWKTNKSPCYPRDWKGNPIEELEDDNGDPPLDRKVTEFNGGELRNLFDFTQKGCGARHLWADAMALCGSTVEEQFEADGPKKWHPDLVFEVMRTALRLVRVRRTLKIEERHPSSWCKRYHEHGKHALPCYRELAGKGASAGAESPIGQGMKRMREETESESESERESETSPSKRARF